MIEEPLAETQQSADWKLEAGEGTLAPRSALDVLTNLNERIASGRVEEFMPIATGFVPMDKTIGGGLRPGELMLIGGAQGAGKTTMALQMARNMAASGQATVLYVCFEHEEEYLIQRLIAMESALTHLPQKSGAVKIQDVKKEVLGSYTAAAETGTRAKLGANPRLRPSLERIARYGSNLYLMRGTATTSTVDNLRSLVEEHRGDEERRLVLFVDYLQKVPVIPEPTTEEEKVTRIVSGLKDIALSLRGAGSRHRRGRPRGPEGEAPAQPPPARLIGHQLRERHHPDHERQVPHRRQGQHRVQPVPGPALPRLGGGDDREEPRRPGQRRPRVREALRVQLLRSDRPR